MKIWMIVLGIFLLVGICYCKKGEAIQCADCKHTPCTCPKSQPTQEKQGEKSGTAQEKAQWFSSLEAGKKEAAHSNKPLLVKVGAAW